MITVFIVDDSGFEREYLAALFDNDPRFKVIGTAQDGNEALKLVPKLCPDVVTMDIRMPGMDGFATTLALMQIHPVPIVIVSQHVSHEENETSFKSMQAGAVAIVEKPRGLWFSEDISDSAAELLNAVEAMAGVKVIRRRKKTAKGARTTEVAVRSGSPETGIPKLIAIGSSTGGPQALSELIAPLPTDFPIPIMVVQHIAIGFLKGFIRYLDRTVDLNIRIALDGEMLSASNVYFAPDNLHMEVTPSLRVRLVDGQQENGTRPSISHLFRTVATNIGPDSVGVLLTGMGRDGSLELREIHESGGLTIIQDKESSAVWGMPGEAARLGKPNYTLPPPGIAQKLLRLASKSKKIGNA